MKFKELQQHIVDNAIKYGELHDVPIDEEFVMYKLVEEVGELYQALLTKKGKCRTRKRLSEDEAHAEVSKEMADVVGMALLCAHILEIDLQDAIEKKWMHKESKDPITKYNS